MADECDFVVEVQIGEVLDHFSGEIPCHKFYAIVCFALIGCTDKDIATRDLGFQETFECFEVTPRGLEPMDKNKHWFTGQLVSALTDIDGFYEDVLEYPGSNVL